MEVTGSGRRLLPSALVLRDMLGNPIIHYDTIVSGLVDFGR